MSGEGQKLMLPTIGRELLERLMEGKTIAKVGVEVKDKQFVYSFE